MLYRSGLITYLSKSQLSHALTIQFSLNLYKQLTLGSLLLGTLLLATGCGHKTDNPANPNGSATSAASASAQTNVLEFAASDLIQAKISSLQSQASITGSLRAEHSTTVQAPFSGTVTDVTAREGSAVHKGMVLVRLNNQDNSARLSQAEANLAGANAQLQLAKSLESRNAQLYQKGFISQFEYQRSQTDAHAQQQQVNAQQSMVNIAKKQVNDSVIKAPMSGIIAKRQVDIGQTVAPNQTLFELVDPNALELQGTAPAQVQAFLQVGQIINFTVANSTTPFKAQITRISPQADAASRSLTFFARVLDQSGVLKIGQFVQGNLAYAPARQGILVPLSAIQSINNSPFVWVIRHNKLEKQPVSLFEKDNVSNQALVNGINDGEQVVLVPLAEGAAGRTVHIST